MQSLKEKRLEEFEKRYPGMLMTGDESGGHDAKPYILDFLSDSIDMAYEEMTVKNAGLYRQLFGEMEKERTFTAKELWKILNGYAPLDPDGILKEAFLKIKSRT